jgi:RsiW-degrading membrane proteinase PrsW (M82 family)
MLIIAGLSSILLPLLFLYIIYALDLYATGSFRAVAVCFVWGLVAAGLAYVLNKHIIEQMLEQRLHMSQLQAITLTLVLVAPIVEEIVKSLILVFYSRRPDFTYFVDGAVYGFAVGIGFSIVENLYYLAQADSASQGQVWAIGRSFSTCLMHGSASALVGVSIGRFRYGHGRTRVLSVILGWGAAILLHSTFNRVARFWQGPALLLGAVGLGVGGMLLIALFVRWGLAEERRWIEETLGIGLGVTKTEKALVLDMQDLDELLKPIEERFGREKADQVEDFLVKQAQLGIKQKSNELAIDPRLRQQIQQQIETLQDEMADIRRRVGTYCMHYVRSIYPPESVALWSNLEQLVADTQQRPAQFDMWSRLSTTAESQTTLDPDDARKEVKR